MNPSLNPSLGGSLRLQEVLAFSERHAQHSSHSSRYQQTRSAVINKQHNRNQQTAQTVINKQHNNQHTAQTGTNTS